MILDLISFSCPLLLASMGALFSEYAGILALFLDGLISFSGFLTFCFTTLTGSLFFGILISCFCVLLLIFIFSFIVEKFKANQFIAAIGMNLFFSSVISLLSSMIFGTRGVLTSSDFKFPIMQVKIFSIIGTVLLLSAAVYFLIFTQKGIYFRITGSDFPLLNSKGINPQNYRIAAWTISGFFAFFAGCILSLRISSYVPNLSSGKGWMALAAVFLGGKKPWKLILCVLIFCGADYFAASFQNFYQKIPTSVFLSFPYLIVLLVLSIKKRMH